MEELQVIETTSGRQFKPWASREDVQAAVQDPASVTAITSEIASGKQAIASAINAKGGTASATESFTELAEAVEEIPNFNLSGYKYINGFTPTNVGEAYLYRRYLNDISDSSITQLLNDVNDIYSYCNALQSISFPNLTTISAASSFLSCTALQSIDLPNLTTISAASVFRNCVTLQSIDLPNLTTINGGIVFYECNINYFHLPKLSFISKEGDFRSNYSVIDIVLGTLFTINSYWLWDNKSKLRNITIGASTDVNLPFQNWTATNVIAEGQSGITELNSNLYNNLLTKLYDHSQDGVTRTLRLGWLANVSAENIAYANAKGWTLTT